MNKQNRKNSEDSLDKKVREREKCLKTGKYARYNPHDSLPYCTFDPEIFCTNRVDWEAADSTLQYHCKKWRNYQLKNDF